jgi:ATPase subunit of ABC transporter with duplicated ATPase domains
MITVTNLSKSFGAQTLFEATSMQLNAGCRYGVVGANGSGKSTLLRIIAGQEEASTGDVSMPRKVRVGVLGQDQFRYEDTPILDVVMMGNPPLWEAMQEKEEILAKAEDYFDGDRYAVVEDVILRHDGYTLEPRAAAVLEGLNIPTAVHREPLSVLSGGFKLRVLLAQTLASEPDALLLDEPTNHLDILSTRWLESFLEGFKGCVVVVSHDHRFLNNVTTHIVDVDYERVTLYTGNYDAFIHLKQADRTRMEAEISKREKEIAEQTAFVQRFKAKATKARQAQSKAKRIEKIVIPRLPVSSRRYPKFIFRQKRHSGKSVVRIDGLCKSYGDKDVLVDVTMEAERGDRLAIIGANGIGKSTLLKIMVGQVEADMGECEWGYETHQGYFAQDHRELLAGSRATVLSWLWDFCPAQPIGFCFGRLARMLFSREDTDKKVTALSGGEAARLIFSRLDVTEPNVLLLDEPTNHLDLEGIAALADGLEAYDGTLIFVSHDRWFVSRLATRIIELTPDGLTNFRGSYEEYLVHCGDDHLDAKHVVEQARKVKSLSRMEKGGSNKGKKKKKGAPDQSEADSNTENDSMAKSKAKTKEEQAEESPYGAPAVSRGSKRRRKRQNKAKKQAQQTEPLTETPQTEAPQAEPPQPRVLRRKKRDRDRKKRR